jgi:hypothetical protein
MALLFVCLMLSNSHPCDALQNDPISKGMLCYPYLEQTRIKEVVSEPKFQIESCECTIYCCFSPAGCRIISWEHLLAVANIFV